MSPIKVAIDVSPLFSNHQFRGIGFYTKRLAEAYGSVKEDVDFEFIKDASELKFTDADVIHYPYFAPFFISLPSINIAPVVVTVHDLIPIKYRDHFPAGIKGSLRWEVQKRRLRKVNAIITDSEIWKGEISCLTDYPLEKIFAIPLAAGGEFRVIKDRQVLDKTKAKYNLPDNFILYVGDVNWHKNITGLIKAFSILVKEIDCKLVLVGKAFENLTIPEVIEIRNLVAKQGLSNKVMYIGWIENVSELVALYNLATVYCQPSYDEGFGLPVIEAMTCGCPTVVSSGGSLPEVSGEASILVNPALPEDIMTGLLALLKNKTLRNDYQKKGLSWSKKFDWQKTAKATIDVYKSILK